ncbi:putative nucleotidyltransferase with HDIG domain [Desulfobotulus alkaliphilus]|uniref:Putative nucleotidyltransferase with HDIG domain n=2 Tax=Desulfobotulus alkaliphilus TaxID=622671 RepID=A0A562S665_9BACT|nr:putative nucleotidyltransferase with HDIG domain [Desulfobotulus alkaliphilus]
MPNSAPETPLKTLLDAADKLPSLPKVILTVNAMLQDPETRTKDLSRIIEKDISLVTRILKLVNSAFFGLRSTVGNIPDAVSLLGFDTLHRLTLSLSILDILGPSKKMPGDWLWPHSIRTAVFCEYLAMETQLCRPDDAFVAGLLHDIGLIVLARCMPETFMDLEKKSRESGKPFFLMETSLIPDFSHADMGAAMALKWQLPPALKQAIAQHHRLPKGTIAPLSLLVHTANMLDSQRDLVRNELPAGMLHPLAIKKMRAVLKNPHIWFPPLHEKGREACHLFLGSSHG